MSEIKISKRYARAIFEFATEQKKVEEVKNDMDYVYQLCETSPDFVKLLKSPVIKVSKKVEIIKAVFDGKISILSMHYLEIIAKSRRETFIPAIAGQYIASYNESIGLEIVDFESAYEMDAKLKDKIIKTLSEQTGKQIQLKEKINEDLIGGFIINMNNRQYDASIRARLTKLKAEFVQ
jgi:F-type H+-transporting ATPase subunit delta